MFMMMSDRIEFETRVLLSQFRCLEQHSCANQGSSLVDKLVSSYIDDATSSEAATTSQLSAY